MTAPRLDDIPPLTTNGEAFVLGFLAAVVLAVVAMVIGSLS